MARERGGVREESRTIPATYAYSHIRQIGANHGKRKAGFWGQLVLGLAGLQKNKNRGRVHPSLSTMHSRMHDLCALLNPISVDSANPVSDHRLFRAREDRGLVPSFLLFFFISVLLPVNIPRHFFRIFIVGSKGGKTSDIIF